jgi:ribonuclease HI
MIKIYCDGASKGNPGTASLGVWATNENGDGNSGESIFEISKPLGVATNNVAEWQSLLHALRKAKELGLQKVQVFMDSELVVFQVTGKYKVKKPEFKPFWEEVQNLKKEFQSFSISHVRREGNKKADSLANQAIG